MKDRLGNDILRQSTGVRACENDRASQERATAPIVIRVIAPHKRALLLFSSLELAARYIDERNHIGVHSPVAIATSKELEEVLDHMRILGITEIRLDPSKTNSGKITSEEMLIAVNQTNLTSNDGKGVS